MAKILLSMQDLQARALAEIRKQPGCSNVSNIAINHVTDERAENNWSLCVLSAGTAEKPPPALKTVTAFDLHSSPPGRKDGTDRDGLPVTGPRLPGTTLLRPSVHTPAAEAP